MKHWKALAKLALTAFLVGGINGVHVYLNDHKDFNLEAGFESLVGVFIVAGVTGAFTHALRSPLEGRSDDSRPE